MKQVGIADQCNAPYQQSTNAIEGHSDISNCNSYINVPDSFIEWVLNSYLIFLALILVCGLIFAFTSLRNFYIAIKLLNNKEHFWKAVFLGGCGLGNKYFDGTSRQNKKLADKQGLLSLVFLGGGFGLSKFLMQLEDQLIGYPLF